MASKVKDPRKKPLDLIELQNRRELAKKTRRAFERDWLLNLAYLHNEQYVDYSMDTGKLVVLQAPDDATRTVHNVMMKLARVERSRMLKTQPRPQVLPASDSDDDEMLARMLEGYCSQLMHEWNFPRRLRELTYWVVATGNAWLKWYWAGGNQVDVITPFEMYIDPYVRQFEQARWCIQGRFYDEETAWDLYGDYKGANTDHLVPGQSEPMNLVEHRIFADIGIGAGTSGGGSSANLTGITTYEYWEPPNKSVPDGRYIVFTDSGIVIDEKYPYTHGKMPFTHITHLVRASSKYAASVMDYLRAMQDELNRAESQNIENRNLANPKWYLPPGLQLEQDPTAAPRQILRGMAGSPLGAKPEAISVDSYPAWALEYPERLKSFMQDVAGQHEVSNAQVPGRVDSGSGIQLLQESDMDVIQDAVMSLQESISEGFWQSIALTQQFGDPDIIVKSYDRDGFVEVREFKKASINLDFQVRVQTTTSLPQSIVGKWDRVLSLVQYGVIMPQQAAEILDLSVENPSLVPFLHDRKHAYRENKRMANGEPWMPLMWQDHDAHLRMHREFMKTEEFEKLDPDAQELFLVHERMHVQMREQVAAEEGRYKALLEGAPPAPAAAPADGTTEPTDASLPPADEAGPPAVT
jgi:hypothetical protein